MTKDWPVKCQIIRSLNAYGVFSGYSRRRTRRNKGPFDKPAAAVQASIATLTKGGMGTVVAVGTAITRCRRVAAAEDPSWL